MSFTRANLAGWAPLEELTAAQINHIDINQSRAIDGTDGGLYTPGALTTIDGAFGWRFDAPFRATDTFQVDSATALFTQDVQIDVDLYVDGFADFDGAMDVQGFANFQAAITGTALTLSGNLVVNGLSTLGNAAGDIVTLNGAAEFNNGFDVNGGNGDFQNNLNCVGQGTFGTLDVLGTASFQGVLFFAGAGRVRWDITTIAADSNQTIVPNGGLIVIGSGVLSAAHNWTIDDTGMADGDWFIAYNLDITHGITVRDPATNPLGTIKLASGFSVAQLFVRVGGVWRAVLVGNVL